MTPSEALGALRDDTLHLTVMPTEKCNFRCVYCYEDFAKGAMSGDTVIALKDFLARRLPGLRRLKLSWFGGEPLNATRIMFDLLEFVQAERPAECRFTSDVTTNGYRLSPDILDRLVALDVGFFQISLDGDRAEHDSTRILANGRGTFDRIWSNLRAAKESDRRFRILLRIHVDRQKLATLPDFVARLAEEFGGDDRFCAFFKPIAKLGGPNDDSLGILGPEERAQLAGIQSYAERLGIATQSLRDNYICYAAKPNAFVVRSDGSLSKCTVAFDRAENHVGRLMPGGTLRLDQRKIGKWTETINFDGAEQDPCPLGQVAF